MQKRLLALILAAVLALSAGAVAAAETETWSITANDVSLNKVSNTLGVKSADLGRYALVNTRGEVLTQEPYIYLSADGTYGYFKTEVDAPDGIHGKGLIDSAGKTLVPAQYYSVEIVNAHWQIGTTLIPATSEDNDVSRTNYSNGTKTFYRYNTHDFYFDGQKVGTLTRAEKDEYGTYGYGEYICVRDRIGAYHYFDKEMNESPLTVTSSGEYAYERVNGKYIYYHVGSGQKAFVPECTLTPGQVANPYLESDGLYYDLQGNQVFTPKVHYASVSRFDGRFALIRLNSLYGVIDGEGNQVLPAEYDSIGDYEDHLFQFGYAAVVKEGKLGFADSHGNITAPFSYSASAANVYGCFARIKDLDGNYIVISGAVGELPERYTDVSFPGYYGCMAFVAQNAAGAYGVVGLNGETLVPFDGANRSINLTVDGRVAVVYRGSNQYLVYVLDEQTLPEAPEQPADDGTWTCSQGHSGNTGNFCPVCGEPKPAENKCPNCNHDFGDQEPSKFCPECGYKMHD